MNHLQTSELRLRAEKKVEQRFPAIEDGTPEQIRKLTEELHTYQIELELQNEELWQTQGQLEETLAKYTDLYDFAPVGYLTIGENGDILEANLTAADMLEITRKKLIDTPFSKFIVDDEQDTFYRHRKNIIESGKKSKCNLHLKTATGSAFFVIMHSLVVLSKNDEPQRFRTAIVDITDRKEAERRMAKALGEKEELLQEIHHRVKNNLQIVASLLTIQAAKIDHETASKCLLDSRDRVRSMAVIHEMLYEADDLANVEMAIYVPRLVNKLQQTYEMTKTPIGFSYDIENIGIVIDRAIPCGLIINELVANSLKYGFTDKRKGQIRISFRRADKKAKAGTAGGFELTVSDDGIGMPENVDIKNCDTFGLHLVKLLAENQLGGKLELLVDGNGTTIKVTFLSEE